MDRHEIHCDSRMPIEKPHSLKEMGSWSADSYFPPARLYGMELCQLSFLWRSYYHDFYWKSVTAWETVSSSPGAVAPGDEPPSGNVAELLL